MRLCACILIMITACEAKTVCTAYSLASAGRLAYIAAPNGSNVKNLLLEGRVINPPGQWQTCTDCFPIVTEYPTPQLQELQVSKAYVVPSGITSKPAIRDHLKTGQRN
jgi:hypothetical protein